MKFRTSIAVIMIAFGVLSPAGRAENQTTFERRTPIVLAYQKAYKAVVNISGKRMVSSSLWPGSEWSDPFGWDFFGPRFRMPIVVLGSGVVIHEDGYIVTNAHVVRQTEQIKVTFSNGKEYPAEVLSAAEDRDLAVLKIETREKLPFIHLGRSDDLMIGETVIAIGNPFGYSNTLTTGVVSAIGRDIQVAEGFWLRGLIQTEAPINPGNSGGPLLNINGELIGITTAIKPEAQNIGFAIPVDELADNLSHMLMPEKMRRVRLGLLIGRIKKFDGYLGLAVDSVVPGSPAAEQGLAKGDLILEIDGKKVNSFIDFYVRMMNKEIGEPIEIQYIRPAGPERKQRIARLTIASRPLPDGRKLAVELFQVEISELTADIAQRFGFDRPYPLLIITDVLENGQAAKAGLAPGDVVLNVSGSAVSNMHEFSLEMEKVSAGDTIELRILHITVRGSWQYQRQYTVQLKAEPRETNLRKFL